MNTEEIRAEVARIEQEIKQELKQINGLREKKTFLKMAYKKFDVIYEKYGQKGYCEFVPRKYRKIDERVLIGEREFLALYNKHGENAYKRHKDLIKQHDIELRTGSSLKGWLYRSRKFAERLVLLTGAIVVGRQLLDVPKQKQIENRKVQENIDIVEDYLSRVDKFGKEVREKNLSDIENVMYVMYDMWENTQGYGNPRYDIIQYAGLDMADSSGYGVCRNMADDTARKLNAINPDYNARVMSVYYTKGEKELANIDRKETNGQKDENGEIATVSDTTGPAAKLVGNHVVVLFHSIEDNVELVCDPTNPGIGIIMNGKIKMFNEVSNNNSYKEEYTPLGEVIYGAKKVAQIPFNYLSSIGIYTKSEKEYLQNKYGVEAQNKALEDVKEAKPKSFYDSIKVDENIVSANKNDKSRSEDNINKKDDKGSEITL